MRPLSLGGLTASDWAVVAEATRALDVAQRFDSTLLSTFSAYEAFVVTLNVAPWPLTEHKLALFVLDQSATSARPAFESLQRLRNATISIWPDEHGDAFAGTSALLGSVLEDVTSASGSSSGGSYAPLTPPPSAKASSPPVAAPTEPRPAPLRLTLKCVRY